MGRRSTNTTKHGKFMNPTDQARKEARKRELKKNKKQRKLVRETVLKLKDPIQIVEEMLRLDMLDLEGLSENINEKVVEEKKRKLDETLNRILTLYEKTDKEKYAEIKKFQVECDRKRHKALLVYQSQKQKEEEEIQRKKEEEQPSLNLTEIALPHSGIVVPDEIPLPTPQTISLPGVEKPETSSSAMLTEDSIPQIPGLPPGLIPPGPPPGSPPRSPEYTGHLQQQRHMGGESSRGGDCDIDPIAEMQRLENEFNAMEEERLRDDDYDSNDEYQDEDDDDEDGEDEEGGEGGSKKRRKRKVRFREEGEGDGGEGGDNDGGPMTMQKRLLKLAGHDPKQLERSAVPPGAPPGLPPGAPPSILPGPPTGAPPGPPPGAPPRAIPGPPPGRPPGPPPGMPRPPSGMPPMGLPPRVRPPGIGQAGGVRPQQYMTPTMQQQSYNPTPQPTNVIQKGPEIKRRQDNATTISAKPVLKNLRAEVTKFVPTAVKIRRNPTTSTTTKKVNLLPRNVSTTAGKDNEEAQGEKVAEKKTSVEPTKDDVYAKFMSEMTGFL